MLLERLGSLDAQEREEQERDDGRAQAVERRADGAVDVARDLDDPAVLDRGEREQHPGAGHALAVAEQRGGVVEQAELGEHPVEPPVGWIPIGRELERLVVGGRSGSGQVWVRGRLGRRGGLGGGRGRSGQVWVRGRLGRRGGLGGGRGRSGQVWVRGRPGERQLDLRRRGRWPTQPAELLADRLLGHTDPLRDLTEALALYAQGVDAP